MKRVLGIICCIICALTVYAESSAITLKMLKDASVAEGKEYLQKRDAIIKKASVGKTGEEFLLELKDAATDESLSWRVRLMANICIERGEKGIEINELINYKWRTHPEYEKEWEQYLGGPMQFFWPTVCKKLKEKKMWFYYLDIAWKKTGEYDMTIPKIRDSSWPGMCKTALTDSPESYYLFRILEDRISREQGLGKYDTLQTYLFIIKHSDKSSFRFILDTLDKSGFHKTGYFMDILPNAKLDDMEYIRQYGKKTKMNADERDEFNRQLSRLNKKFGLTSDGKPVPESAE